MALLREAVARCAETGNTKMEPAARNALGQTLTSSGDAQAAAEQHDLAK